MLQEAMLHAQMLHQHMLREAGCTLHTHAQDVLHMHAHTSTCYWR